MATISARTFRYSRLQNDNGVMIYYFYDRNSSRREWRLVRSGLAIAAYKAIKSFPHKSTVLQPRPIRAALMAALTRHQKLVQVGWPNSNPAP